MRDGNLLIQFFHIFLKVYYFCKIIILIKINETFTFVTEKKKKVHRDLKVLPFILTNETIITCVEKENALCYLSFIFKNRNKENKIKHKNVNYLMKR